MDITNITHSRFADACYRAGEHLMHAARQATRPEDMLRLAISASYAELYIDAYSTGNMYWGKFLAIFEFCFGDAQDIDRALAGHVEQMAKIHAAADISTGNVRTSTNLSDFDWNQLPAYANQYMLESKGIDEALVSRRACSLLHPGDKHVSVQEGHVTLQGECKDMDAAKDEIAAGSPEKKAPLKDAPQETH